MTFPDTPLDLKIEAAFGANLRGDQDQWEWTDLDDNVAALTWDGEPLEWDGVPLVWSLPGGGLRRLQQQATILRGRADESSESQPASVTLVLDNTDGALTPGNPLSPWWPHVRPGTPLRVTLDGAEFPPAGLRQGGDAFASTPDHSSLDITGDLDLRFEGEIDWSGDGALAVKWDEAGDQRSYGLWLWRSDDTDRSFVAFTWSADGTAATVEAWTVEVPFRGVVRGSVRASLDVDDGAGGHVVRFFWRTPSGSWEQLAEIVGTGTTSVHAGTGPLSTSGTLSGLLDVDGPATGRVRRIVVLDGIDGTPVADIDFTDAATGSDPVVDHAGRTWTPQGGAEVDATGQVRFVGDIAEVSPRWPAGDVEDWSEVVLTGAGILRRLGRARRLDSPLRRATQRQGLLAYWPFEDGPTATRAASGVGGRALLVSGAAFGADSSLVSSMPLPKVEAGNRCQWVSTVTGSPTEFTLQVMVNMAALPVSDEVVLVEVTASGAVRRWQVTVDSTAVRLRCRNAAGSDLASIDVPAAPLTGGWSRLAAHVVEVGANLVPSLSVTPASGVPASDGGAFAGSVGALGFVSMNAVAPSAGFSFGHVAITDGPWQGTVDGPQFTAAWSGEEPLDRVDRLRTEEGVECSAWGPSSVRLGPQAPAKLAEILGAATTADLGVLGEERDRRALAWRSHETLENQVPLVLDAANDEIAVPFEPTADDQRLRNDVTVSRQGGSSARAVDEESTSRVDVYESTTTIDIADDEDLPAHARWRLHQGTWPGMRYPVVVVDLVVAPHLVPSVTSLREGDLIRIINLPAQHSPDPVDLIVEQIAESFTDQSWRFELVCSPGGPWTVGVLDVDRLDTAGTELDAGIDETETTISLTTTAGPVWVDTATDATQFPFDLTVGGERVTVTAITGTTSPQTATVVRSVNGIVKPHAAGVAVALADPFIVAL